MGQDGAICGCGNQVSNEAGCGGAAGSWMQGCGLMRTFENVEHVNTDVIPVPLRI